MTATQWSDIPGADGASYTLTAADVGDEIQLEVTAVNDDGSATADSDTSDTILSAAPVNIDAPAITDENAAGQTVSATSGDCGPGRDLLHLSMAALSG